MQIDITQVILAVITLLGTLITGFVIPLLKSKISENKQAIFDSAVRVAVYAAEQIFSGSKQGKEKKSYVIDLLRKQGYVVDDEIIDAAIEAQVKMMKEYIDI